MRTSIRLETERRLLGLGLGIATLLAVRPVLTADGLTFTKITTAAIATDREPSFSCAWSDYDNDGFIDLLVSNWGRIGVPGTNALYYNNNDGTFTRITTGPVVTDVADSIAGVWGDYDNDGFLDLFVSNRYNAQPNFLYHNNGDGTFTKVTTGAIVTDSAYSFCCVWGDYDNDGFLDLFVANGGDTQSQANSLYHNNGNTNSWLVLKLIGTVSNRSAIGTKARLRASIRGQTVWQLREISGGHNFGSQNDPRAHFGLGDATNADLVRIEWPSGIVQELQNVPAEQILEIKEPAQLVPLGPTEFQIRCWKGMRFEVQKSINLTTWDSLGMVTNVTGTLSFQDTQGVPQAACCFYRVVSQ